LILVAVVSLVLSTLAAASSAFFTFKALILLIRTLMTQIPFGVGNLSRLISLNLSDSFCYGQMPKSLANLSYLETLDLQYYYLQGEFPTEIFLLPNLWNLIVAYNEDLIGHLPEFHSNSSLELLTLEGTSFMINYRIQLEV
jgi:hypothetical protein